MTHIKVDQKKINLILDTACDTFRGAMSSTHYQEYILVMLFIKYMSDVWKEYEQHPDKHPAFILPNDCSFYALYENRFNESIGVFINTALNEIEAANPEHLSGVFRGIDFNSDHYLGKHQDRNKKLVTLLEVFHQPDLDLSPSRISQDVMGNAYMHLMKRCAADRGFKAGEFYTPHCIVELIAKLAQPPIGGSICDPTCGSGGLLLETAKQVGIENCALYGMELNGGTWALCKMNMLLHGATKGKIEWCNTLLSPGLVEDGKLIKFDTIVGNPPFSVSNWGAEHAEKDPYNRFWRGVPPQAKGDYAFISHMIETAKEGEGRVVVVVPHGLLFRMNAEGRIRQKLIEQNLLDAVISLPEGLFANTTIPVALMIFDRSREKGGFNDHITDVLIIDASQEFYNDKVQKILMPEHIQRILDTYKHRKPVDRYAHLASAEELKENNYNLSISYYIDQTPDEPKVDLYTVEEEIERLQPCVTSFW